MKPVLIIKVGETYPFIADIHGDFDHMVIHRSGRHRHHFIVSTPFKDEPLPDPGKFSGIIITGSHDMVTANKKWSQNVEKWIVGALDDKIPLLGICYGHQLIARAAGGVVGNNPMGMEFGTITIRLAPTAARDALFGSFPSSLKVQACHTQSVLKLPAKATLLASSRMDPHHAFVIGGSAWGVQFHPEFDAHIMRMYIKSFSQALNRQETDVEMLLKTLAPTVQSENFIKIFVEQASADFH